MSSNDSPPWTPPERPDPQQILNEAVDDTRAKRFEIALAKFVWFHQNAIRFDNGLYGVRLSFALSYWHELAEEYPPALTQLENVRDLAKWDVMNGKDVFHSFHDLRALNRVLCDDRDTLNTFLTLDRQDQTAAVRAYPLAQPLLVAAREYSLCGKYLRPEAALERLKTFDRERRMLAGQRFTEEVRLVDSVERSFGRDITILIALLVVNQRECEAAGIAIEAKKVWSDPDHHSEFDRALAGRFPES